MISIRKPISVGVIAASALIALQGRPASGGQQVPAGATPTVRHGELVLGNLALDATIKALRHDGKVAWVGYSVEVVPGLEIGSISDRTTYLEEETEEHASHKWIGSGDLKRATVLLRVTGDAGVTRVDFENPDNTLEAGGKQVFWLRDVSVDESSATLVDIARGAGDMELADGAMRTIAFTQSPRRLAVLEGLTSPQVHTDVRERAAFWLASTGGREGFGTVRELCETEKDPAFRTKLTFDLTLIKSPEALEELIRLVRNDDDSEVRSQAQFWLSQVGGPRAIEVLRDSAEHEKDAGARAAAVFAISRLPNGEATQQLISLAENSDVSDTRKTAVFWLTQSDDPKALSYLTHGSR